MAGKYNEERGARKPRVARDENVGRKRARFLDGVKHIDIGDPEFMQKFVTEHGKIMPGRLTGASALQQRQIKRGVRRARTMGLLP